MKVLIVEDNANLADVVRMGLSPWKAWRQKLFTMAGMPWRN